MLKKATVGIPWWIIWFGIVCLSHCVSSGVSQRERKRAITQNQRQFDYKLMNLINNLHIISSPILIIDTCSITKFHVFVFVLNWCRNACNHLILWAIFCWPKYWSFKSNLPCDICTNHFMCSRVSNDDYKSVCQ